MVAARDGKDRMTEGNELLRGCDSEDGIHCRLDPTPEGTDDPSVNEVASSNASVPIILVIARNIPTSTSQEVAPYRAGGDIAPAKDPGVDDDLAALAHVDRSCGESAARVLSTDEH